MTDPLHVRLPVTSLADKAEVFEISAKIGDFDRLAAAIDADLAGTAEAPSATDWRELPVTGRLQFGVAAAGEPVVSVDLSADVTSVCQRSLEVFRWQLETAVRFRLAPNGEAVAELDGYETWELDDDVIVPIELADEALVMAMPLSVTHDEAVVEADAGATGRDVTRPFADLRAQMDKVTDE